MKKPDQAAARSACACWLGPAAAAAAAAAASALRRPRNPAAGMPAAGSPQFALLHVLQAPHLPKAAQQHVKLVTHSIVHLAYDDI